MRTPSKIITALALAGIAVAGGAAFTATGVATSGQAASEQFVGGTVGQNVVGATLTNVTYSFVNDGTKTMVSGIDLTFAPGATDRYVNVAATGGGTGVGTFTRNVQIASNHALFTYTAGGDTLTGYLKLDNLAITVTEASVAA